MEGPLQDLHGQPQLAFGVLYHTGEVPLAEPQTYLVIHVKYLSGVRFRFEEALVYQINEELQEYILRNGCHLLMSLLEHLILSVHRFKVEYVCLLGHLLCRNKHDDATLGEPLKYLDGLSQLFEFLELEESLFISLPEKMSNLGLLDLRLWGSLQLQLDLPIQTREGDSQHLTQVFIVLSALVFIG